MWKYFSFFFMKKKEALTRNYGVFTRKQKALVIWAVLLLLANSFNFLVNNVLEMMFVFNFLSQEFEETWSIAMYFWFELLILNNGVLFLILFMHLAKFKVKRRQSRK